MATTQSSTPLFSAQTIRRSRVPKRLQDITADDLRALAAADAAIGLPLSKLPQTRKAVQL
jgi:hypothetical protein